MKMTILGAEHELLRVDQNLLVEIDDEGEVFPRFRIAPLKTLVPKEYICLPAAED